MKRKYKIILVIILFIACASVVFFIYKTRQAASNTAPNVYLEEVGGEGIIDDNTVDTNNESYIIP